MAFIRALIVVLAIAGGVALGALYGGEARRRALDELRPADAIIVTCDAADARLRLEVVSRDDGLWAVAADPLDAPLALFRRRSDAESHAAALAEAACPGRAGVLAAGAAE